MQRCCCRPAAALQRAARPPRIATVVSAAPVPSPPPPSSSPPSVHSSCVYIEDTDAYGVVYYANYFRLAARAREELLGWDTLRLLQQQGVRPVVLAVDKARYSSAAVLGDRLAVYSEAAREGTARLRLRQRVAPAAAPADAAAHVSAELLLGFARIDGALVDVPPAVVDRLRLEPAAAAPPLPPPPPFAGLRPVAETRVRVYADEAHSAGAGAADEVSVLRWFERCRTESIGGADGLRALKEAGVLVVVTGISELRIDGAVPVRPGDELVARAGAVLRARNTVVVFQQELWRGDALVARGEVTCAGVSAADMRLCPCPPDLAARLQTPLAQQQ